MSTTIGVRFTAFFEDLRWYSGSSMSDWIELPQVGLLLCDVYEPTEYEPGKQYRWRMECDAFGCRQTDQGLEFCRWDEGQDRDESFVWKFGHLVSDELMDEIRALANPRD